MLRSGILMMLEHSEVLFCVRGVGWGERNNVSVIL